MPVLAATVADADGVAAALVVEGMFFPAVATVADVVGLAELLASGVGSGISPFVVANAAVVADALGVGVVAVALGSVLGKMRSPANTNTAATTPNGTANNATTTNHHGRPCARGGGGAIDGNAVTAGCAIAAGTGKSDEPRCSTICACGCPNGAMAGATCGALGVAMAVAGVTCIGGGVRLTVLPPNGSAAAGGIDECEWAERRSGTGGAIGTGIDARCGSCPVAGSSRSAVARRPAIGTTLFLAATAPGEGGAGTAFEEPSAGRTAWSADELER